jgi:sulfate adenylyltransferase subunit 1 (EFTu-like GTPase family)
VRLEFRSIGYSDLMEKRVSAQAMPISILYGDNLVEPSSKAPWYTNSANQVGGAAIEGTLVKLLDAELP